MRRIWGGKLKMYYWFQIPILSGISGRNEQKTWDLERYRKHINWNDFQPWSKEEIFSKPSVWSATYLWPLLVKYFPDFFLTLFKFMYWPSAIIQSVQEITFNDRIRSIGLNEKDGSKWNSINLDQLWLIWIKFVESRLK